MPSRAPLLAVAAAVLVLSTGVAGCSDDGDSEPAPAVHTAANGDVYNAADADFATDLVQHHALALVLVDLSRAAQVSPDLTAVAAEVLDAGSVEIQTATGWLAEWDLPVPETIRDHANAHAAERGEEVDIPGGELPGMPDHADLAELEELTGPDFEQRWLELMVAHHEGAIVIAEEEAGNGEFAPAVELAESVAATQEDQIEQMRALLGE
ncbi:DUF305 domain-containing protein [Nocardioides sp. HM23]|uniref:DUF305 domain-containing protein n=1 Tax=Nocardioides bizhenqiangii TaxID=3095076 RepID=UPI002ACABB77|nr:DUF305 domain-containing protein [Nocardioides sp. HM23]MDZ5619971.1 DUF305 domain-containing protein [Nocardioides sp. HM23]